MTRISDARLAELVCTNDPVRGQYTRDIDAALRELQALRAVPREMESAADFAEGYAISPGDPDYGLTGWEVAELTVDVAKRDAAHNLEKQALREDVERLRSALASMWRWTAIPMHELVPDEVAAAVQAALLFPRAALAPTASQDAVKDDDHPCCPECYPPAPETKP